MKMLLLLIVLILLFGVGGSWYSHTNNWGVPGGTGVVGLVVIIIVLWLLFGGDGYLHTSHIFR
jgi:Protein of unknown function (DUF3309)